ncbi:hypothetical protein D3C73_1447790 [compost metagenome]
MPGLQPLNVIATDTFANLRERPAPYRSRRQFTLGRTLAAFSRQLGGQPLRQENSLLRPAARSQVVNDT